jgi:NAD-dependent deacetylase
VNPSGREADAFRDLRGRGSARAESRPAENLARLIRERQPCVALTGAGISTESGIPDFRSPTGIWASYDPMEYATIQAFRRDPVKVWDFYGKRLGVLEDARPNAAHLALAELERLGLLEAVITQNIDRLHELAGSRDVLEVHGSIRTFVCLACGTRATLDEVVALLENEPAPPCPSCGSILKPGVVMFGELLPAAELERAYELAQGAGLLLVVGSSLEVHPVAGLPLETLAAGGEVAIVNQGPTPLDSRATLKIEAAAGETLAAVVEALD